MDWSEITPQGHQKHDRTIKKLLGISHLSCMKNETMIRDDRDYS